MGNGGVFSFPCSSWHGIPGAVPGRGDQGPAGCHRLGTALDEHCSGAEPGAPSPCTLRDVPVPLVQHRDLQVGPGVLEGKLRSESRSSAESKSAPSHPQNECLAAWFSVRWDGGEGAAPPLGFSQRRSPWCVFPPPGTACGRAHPGAVVQRHWERLAAAGTLGFKHFKPSAAPASCPGESLGSVYRARRAGPQPLAGSPSAFQLPHPTAWLPIFTAPGL